MDLPPLYYLSFVGPDGWRGAVIVPGETLEDAILMAKLLYICPGGEVMGAAYPAEAPRPPAEYQGRLLSRDDVTALDARTKLAAH